MKVLYGMTSDIESWMKLVKKVSWNFPGLETAIEKLDRTKDITVSTFRKNDDKGEAPRALYKKH